jgi:hypothetical protein
MTKHRIHLTVIAFLLMFRAGSGALPLARAQEAATLEAWQEYVGITEGRIDRELSASNSGFFVQDFQSPDRVEEDNEALFRGQLIIEKMKTEHPDGSSIKVPDGLIHHWRGAVFIPDVELSDVLDAVRHPELDIQQEDVLEARVLERTDAFVHVYLKLVRSKIITATYNTEHYAYYRRYGAGRASSSTVAIRIAELKDAGTPDEREKTAQEDRGFLWRLNSYWRYAQVNGGVMVECESLSLGRSIPFLARPFVGRIVNGVAKESLGRTLSAMRGRFLESP